MESSVKTILRFSEFNSDWGQDALGALCSCFKSGQSITSEQISEFGDYKVFGGNGLRGYTKSFTHDGTFVLIGRQGALCGNINKVNGRNFISEHAIAVQGNEIMSTDWLEYKLYLMNLNKLSESSAQPGLAVNKLVKLKIFYPSLPEQQKIASFLSAVDEKIRQLTRKKELLEQYKKGVMQQLFSGKLRFKDENGKEFPEWEETDFQDLADKKIKWSLTGGPFGSNLKAEDYTKEGVRIIQLQNIGDGEFFDESKIYTSEDKANELLSCNIYPGEIILSKMGDPVARACFIPQSHDRWLMSSDGIRLAIDKEKFDKNYVVEFINSPFFRNQALSVSTGSTRKRIGLSELKILKIKSPSLKEQKLIGALFHSLNQKIESIAYSLDQSNLFKKGLLQQMFV